MNEDLHFSLDCNVVDCVRHFSLNLSCKNIDFLLQDCPEMEDVSG